PLLQFHQGCQCFASVRGTSRGPRRRGCQNPRAPSGGVGARRRLCRANACRERNEIRSFLMRGFWAIYKRELFAFFVTPIAWVLLCCFLAVQGLHFQLLVEHFSQRDLVSDQTPLQAFFGNTIFFYLILFLFAP